MKDQSRTYLSLGCVILLAPILVCGFALYIPIYIHNVHLGRFANSLYSYPLPAQTTVINKDKKVGLMGNGNHCDFLAEQVLSTKLSRPEIEAYYQGVKFPAVWGEDQQIFVHVSFDGAQSTTSENIFTISALDFGNPTNFDIRCY